MYHTAVILTKTQGKQGSYTVQQLQTQKCPSIASFSQRKDRRPIEVTIEGLYHISGWIDSATSEMILHVDIGGHDLGVFHGMANQALRIDLHLNFVKGSIKVELNPFDELWVHVDTVKGGQDEGLPIFDCKKSEQVQRLPAHACEAWL
ncbi:hypothetical protein BJX76DRAFT_357676 [Aspergillus varians]